jgi:putative oxidoreductase
VSDGVRSLLRDVDGGSDRLRPAFLLAVRGVWGLQFALAGLGKLTHLEDAAAAFAGWGFPLPELHAVAAGSTELLGGVLLATGLFARPAGLVLSVVMMVALGTAHRPELLAATWTDGSSVLTAPPATFLLAALTILFAGPGPWALDAVLLGRPARGHDRVVGVTS